MRKDRVGCFEKTRFPLLRCLRKEAVMRALEVGAHLAQRGSRRHVDLLHDTAVLMAKACLPLRVRLARNMKAAGLYRAGLVGEHFERAADQMRLLMHVLRVGFDDAEVASRFHLGDSFRHVEQARSQGNGVLIISPHLCCYPLFPRVLADHFPCSIYLRRSPDPRKHALNQLMGNAGGGHLVYPPANASRSERLAVAMRVLREGRGLFITPDLPRQPDEGIAVQILGREVHFPTGVIIMAMRTRAPIVISTWHFRDGAYRVRFEKPMDFSARGDRQARAADGMRTFARVMDDFLCEHPEMWWNWLDKRWTWILRAKSA